jgi:hypothetical protein
MAKINCNLKEVVLNGNGVRTFGDLIVHLTRDVVQHDEVIYRIVVDGEDIPEDRERHMGAAILDDFELIEIYTRKAVDIAIEGMKSACELVPSIHNDMLDAATSVRSGTFDRGYGLISDLAPYLGWYIELITAIERVFVKSGNEFITRLNGMSGIHSFENIEAVREQVVALAQAQEHGDHAAVADILEYELAPLFETWSDEAPLILKRMQELKANA